MTRKFLGFSALLLLFALPDQLSAQSYDRYDGLKYRKYRLTLIPPISTNGTKTMNYTAKYSLNIISGWHGGLSGFEIGGLTNYTRDYSDGVQIAGLANITNGSASGVHIAGLTNYSRNNLSGFHVSGIANIGENVEGLGATAGVTFAKDNVSGLQASGLGFFSEGNVEGLTATAGITYAKGDVEGLGASGIANISGGNIEGLQATLGVNAAKYDAEGLLAAGIGNIAGDNVEGLLYGTFFNLAGEDVSGLVFSFGVNAAEQIEGLVFGGAANVSEFTSGLQGSFGLNLTKELEGVQMGALNLARNIEGVQIGVVNLGKEITGVPVGILSLYGNGRKNIDVRAMDAGFTEVGINLGTYRVYNMIILGYNTLLDDDVYRIGWAIGGEEHIRDVFPNIKNDYLFVNRELSITHQFEGNFDRTTNLIFSYKFNVGKRINDKFSFYAGPSFNAQVTRVDNASQYTWYSIWSPTRKGRQYRFWIGATVGIRLFKQKYFEPRPDKWDWFDIDF